MSRPGPRVLPCVSPSVQVCTQPEGPNPPASGLLPSWGKKAPNWITLWDPAPQLFSGTLAPRVVGGCQLGGLEGAGYS